MRIAHRGSGLEMTFNEPFVAGKNASSWRTNNPLGKENQGKKHPPNAVTSHYKL